MTDNEQRTRPRFQVLPQPDDRSCGPTCLHAVYRFWDREMPLFQLRSEIEPLPEGGTLAVTLATHALHRGFDATIYTYNVQLFDPTWFAPEVDLSERLRKQREAKSSDTKLCYATDLYLDYLALGGAVRFEPLTHELLERLLRDGIPVLTGLSVTYLDQSARELDDQTDDIAGYPVGHFVVLTHYDRETNEVSVADPLDRSPQAEERHYHVEANRLMASILLGVITYDANLLVLTPKK